MSTPHYLIFMRDIQQRRIAELDTYASASFKPRFNQVGFWQLTVPYQDRLRPLFIPGNGIIVMRNGVPIISGPIRHFRRHLTSTSNTYDLSGPDDVVWLNDRLAYPVPLGPPYASQEADVRTGVAETVIKGYVTDNAGPAASVARQVTSLVVAADQRRGSVVTGRGRFVELLPFITDLAISGGDLGYRVTQTNDTLVFDCYQPADRTASAIFSVSLGNLDGFDYDRNSAQANYIIAGGQGVGTARSFAEAGDGNSILDWGRTERFLDRRDVAATPELLQAIQKDIAEKAEQFELQLTPTPTDAMQYGRDYGLGDRVTVNVDGTLIQEVIREVSITLSADRGETVEPVIGTPGMRHRLGFFSRFSHVQAALGLIQRR